MQGLYQIRKTHLWAAGLITLLLFAILGSLLFIQHGQLSGTKADIEILRSEAEKHLQESEKYRKQSEAYKLAAESEIQKLDSLSSELDKATLQLKKLNAAYEKDIDGYNALPTDERLRIFSEFVN